MVWSWGNIMVKLSVSKAARMLGISRFDIQNQINNGKLPLSLCKNSDKAL
jgi:hypothetical protein